MLSTLRCCAAGFALASSVLVLGCHSPEPRQPEAGLTKPVHPPRTPDLGRSAARLETEERYRLFLGETVNICAGPVPYFNTDATKAKGQSEPTMQILANCMIDGPLKGKSIVLVGHTDPRGTEEYNAKLGQKRADDVRRYLIGQGVDPDRVKTQTAGEGTATGAKENWSTDRRVEVQLKDEPTLDPKR